ncbi:MAG: helix-turn-helix domain-containing protein [Oscillospiraceae bacterium]|jgi:DNA-binding MarR family transcriptional regulator|nr:helix-turn-helix domain-containing protein [Oscillospiraceae bacterium]
MSYFDTIYVSELPPRAKAVYMYLRDRSDRSGGCWPSINTIARELSLSRSTVKRAIADLKKAGFVRSEPRYRENGSQSSSLYIVL